MSPPSMVTRIEYDEEARELDIVFTSGKAYRHFDVSPEVYDGFLDAVSKGEFFGTRIKEAYRFEEVLARHGR